MANDALIKTLQSIQDLIYKIHKGGTFPKQQARTLDLG